MFITIRSIPCRSGGVYFTAVGIHFVTGGTTFVAGRTTLSPGEFPASLGELPDAWKLDQNDSTDDTGAKLYYLWQVCDDPIVEANSRQVEAGSQSKFVVTGLTNGMKYWFRVATAGSGTGNQSPWSDPAQKIARNWPTVCEQPKVAPSARLADLVGQAGRQ